MFDSLFGSEGSLIVRVAVALVIVLGLIALAFWLFRRFGGARISAGAARGRQPRLAVVDAAPVDGRRRLILVRRDNVEHLLMIGGPSDVVVEQNIVRAVPVTPPRDVPVPRTPGAVEAASATRALPADEAPQNPPQAELPPRQQAELPRPSPRPDPLTRPPRTADSLARLGIPPGSAPRGAPEPPPIVPASEPAIDPVPPPDAALASMAQRLEAALRRPPLPGETVRPEPPARGTSSFDFPAADSPATAPQAAPTRPDPGAAKSKSVLDSLEEEMANLLGRPPEKQ